MGGVSRIPVGGASPKVVVVARDPLARAGLALLVGTHASQAGDDDAITDDAGVAVWDLGADVHAAAAIAQRAAASPVPVVALVPDGVAPDALLVGAVRALLPRPPDAAQLAAAIAAVRAGLVAIAPALAAKLSRPPRRSTPDRAPTHALTAREQQVLTGLAEGLSNLRIAQSLGIREATVKFHVNAILAKLDADSRTDAVVRAARLGLVMI